MNKITSKLLKWYYKIAGYLILIPNLIIYKYYNPKTLIILGMHRSGTSCITRIFNLCDVYLGKALMKAQLDNPEGFWENELVFEINEKILKQSGGSWDNPPNKLKVTIFDKLSMLSILYSARGNVLGIKDPRMLITWEVWKPLISNYSIVGIFRHPLSVAKSLEKRNGFDISDSLDLWFKYNQKLISIAEVENILLIDFDNSKLFEEKVCLALKELNLKFVDGALNFYNPQNRHSDNLIKIEDAKINAMYSKLKVK